MENRKFTDADQDLLVDIMLHRRDVRGNNFLADEVPDEVVSQILRAATLAPSVGYSQPWEFVMVRDPAIRRQVVADFEVENQKAEARFSGDRRNLYTRLKLEGILEAPVNIAVFYKPSAGPVLGQTSMAEVGEYSVVCAIQNMWLMARALNVGMGWVSILNPDTVKQLLNAPPENKLVGYLCLGYVRQFFDTPELERLAWDRRKPLETVVHVDRYE
ncbi:5,6-dimethylbenzimidazole synthase [Marinobacter zhejiangensis]|uniref:Cob(II)yrinic acid a,c-diamide reductase n=1 Tax=Marinobacter zhejiangensis TaxID=488535 RepID=A0A1I4LIF2_9GAMM|nr:5,6-dimethylbenzimidazole synthase [Marinobacter zhejiangensis]SFL90752.1 cob(II)yrinic acid a,c-diamide reductase [Marinobacter zhejiangensis]